MIHESFGDLDAIDADICIIGAGAAGLTLASEFFDADRTICLLESGKATVAPAPDSLYSFETTELSIAQDSRARTFGGTTTRWSGRWKTLDSIDFSYRPWVEHSGWPISFEDISPYYKRAARLFALPASQTGKPQTMPDLKDSSLEYASFRFVEENKRDLGIHFRTQLTRSKNISVYLDTHVVFLKQEKETVSHLLVKNSSGKECKVRAKTFVLAAGGIENPRLLLASDIGNQHDQVGRYYMDHPKGASGVIEAYGTLDLSESAFFTSHSETFGIRLSDDYQKESHILDSHIYLEALHDTTIPMRMLGKVFPSKHHRSPVALVRNYLEQAPDPSNKVSLSNNVDSFGVPRASIAWSIGDLEKKTMYRFHELLQSELPHLGIGEFKSPLLENQNAFPLTQDASHHMGTTRMGNDPSTSVVNATSKVHGLANLYVAGSSVFPTSGAAGPVATITALSIRLADHLKTYA